jgi:hypothetical protein
MNDRDQRRYDALRRAQTFGVEQSGDFPGGSEGSTRFNNIGAVLGNIDAAKAGQAAGVGNASKVTLIDALRIDCRNIRRTATAIAQDEPGFDDDFPASQHNDASVLTTADAYLAKLELQPGASAPDKEAHAALVARFLAFELPATFVQDLRQDREAVDAAADQQEGKRQGSVEDTAAIGLHLAEGYKELRYANAIVHNKYSRVPEKLRAWKSAIHIERAPRRANKKETPTAGASGEPPKP